MSYAPEPEAMLWLVRGDGDFVSVTVERDNDVIAWCHHETDGLVESVCSIPGTSSDVLFMVVNRDGQRMIEKMEAGVYLDSAVQGTNGSPTTAWAGLDHLEGKTVSVLADGVYIGEEVVSSGAVTISRAASAVTIGLPLAGFTGAACSSLLVGTTSL